MPKVCADKPCPTCPWRKDSAKGGVEIPGFSMELMHRLANTVPERGSRQVFPRTIMACHQSKTGAEYACAGYIAQEGDTNLTVRLMGQEAIDVEAVQAACGDIELYPSFYDMLDAYEAAAAAAKPEDGIPGRVKALIEALAPSKGKWRFLANLTGISATEWRDAFIKRPSPTEQMVTSLCDHFPLWASWIRTGAGMDPFSKRAPDE